MRFEETKGHFGFHLKGGRDEPHPCDLAVQFYVRSSALSRQADLAISPALWSAAEIDRFIDEAIADLQAVRMDAKGMLGGAQG
ncbi:MAG: hypothetical protein K8F92_17535 [Hyphomicrobium sp.]|nr:hypothetical protein [Hyphomicrobium sp.]